MSPGEFKQIRKHIGMTTEEFARELGLSGAPKNCAMRVAEFERGRRPIPPYMARLAFLLQEHFDAESGHLPEWPESCLSERI